MKVMEVLFNVYLQSWMDSSPQERLAKFVIKLRAGRTQRSFARRLGVSYNAVRSWEMCESMPGITSLEKLAAYSGQSIEEVLAYLKGENNDELKKDVGELKVAEDFLPQIQNLSKEEVARLAKLLIEQLLNS